MPRPSGFTGSFWTRRVGLTRVFGGVHLVRLPKRLEAARYDCPRPMEVKLWDRHADRPNQ
jgi:hypothetical protein